MNRLFTTYTAIFVFIALIAPFSLAFFAPRARAGLISGAAVSETFSFPGVPAGVGVGTSVPVYDLGVQQNTAAIAGATRTQALQQKYEWFERFLLDTLRKQLLDMVVSQIINWIQGGGSPKFITDWQEFLADAGNIAVGQFAEEIGLGFLCDPFSPQLRLALGIGAPRVNFSQQITCTLDDIVGNINNFYGDFRNGGWIAYQTMLQPQNNFYGAYFIGIKRRNTFVNRAQFAAHEEGLAGGGFLSSKDCQESPTSSNPDIDGDGVDGDIPTRCRIVTPGSTVGGLVSKAVGSDIDFIVSAQELEAYVAAIADALVNRLIREGVRGLAGLTNSNAPQGGSIPAGQSGCAGLQGNAFTACQNYLNPNPQIEVPTQPTGLNANALSLPTATSTSSIRLTWNDNAVNEDNYRVERSTDNQNQFIVISFNLPANTTDYTDTGLTSGTRYYYRVRATNGVGPSPYSNVADVRAN